jgi:micrococcal nuclease
MRSARSLAAALTILLTLVSCADDDSRVGDPAVPSPTPAPSSTPANDDTQGDEAVATRFVDGDSMEVEIDGRSIEVRLLGINAPELSDCQGPAARAALAELVGDAPVELVGEELDRYGRLLADVVAGGVDVNAEMVSSGWALAIHGSGDRHLPSAAGAAAAGRGLWNPTAGSCVAPPGSMAVVDAVANPPGPDDQNMNEELVVLANTGTTTVDLRGWILRDESTGNRLVMSSLLVAPGERVRVRTGCGTDTRTDVHWCSDGPVWSNGGDTVLLLGPGGSYAAHLLVG